MTTAPLPAPATPGLLRWLAQGPAAVGRSSRRMTRAGLFVAETVSQLARVARQPEPGDVIRRTRRLSWTAEQLCALHGIDVVAEGEPVAGPAVYVANHMSYIDPLAILQHAPSLPIAKAEVGDWPVLGDALDQLGILFVDRACAHSGARVLLQARRLLEEDGAPILAFPEGTTTTGGDVLPFKRGVFGLAGLTGAPVVPVTLRYESTDPCWVGDEGFLPHYVRTTARSHTRVRVRFGRPLVARRGESAEGFAERARTVVRTGLVPGRAEAPLRAREPWTRP